MEHAAVDDGRNRHGFPRGYHFVPHDLELMNLLEEQIAGDILPDPLPNIFHRIRIRNFHPADLDEEYREHEELGYIYFLDNREHRTAGRRPARAAKYGVWKASGGGKELRRAGAVVGYKLTMVFYEKADQHPRDPRRPYRKTEWALNEYTSVVGDPAEKKVASLALYRLYRKKSGHAAVGVADAVSASSSSSAGPVSVKVEAPPSPCATAGGTSSTVYAIMAALTSPQAQASAGQPHHRDHQYGHGAAATSAPGPSNWVTPAAALAAGQDNMPAAEGYMVDEFDKWCETKQEDTQDEDDLSMFMDDSELYSCTLEELLLAPLQDCAPAAAPAPAPTPATSTPAAPAPAPAAAAAPATSTPDAKHQV